MTNTKPSAPYCPNKINHSTVPCLDCGFQHSLSMPRNENGLQLAMDITSILIEACNQAGVQVRIKSFDGIHSNG